MVVIDLTAVTAAGFALRTLSRADTRAWIVLGLLLALALLFEEGATRTARLQRRISGQLKRNMDSVWTVAAAVALPTGHVVLMIFAVATYVYLRQQRAVGHVVYRLIYARSTLVLGALAANLAVDAIGPDWNGVGWALSGSVAVAIAIAVQTAINRGLITIALAVLGADRKALLGTRDDNLIELATLCLGGLVALAALHQPWLCVLVIAPMITLQRGALVRELETAAATDPKTGLLNAVAWEHVANRELARAQREKYDVAVLIIDIDRFKMVNDQYGHLVGDEVLRGVGRVLEDAVREYDSVGRFGGEEFVAVLPKAGDADALVVAERIRSRVHELRIAALIDGPAPEGAAEHALAVSIGVSCSRYDGIEVSDLLVAADSAMYRAKSGGRNRVVLAARGSGPSFAPTR